MSPATTVPRMEMIPPPRQTLWGRPAVVNFVLGGLGAGGQVVAFGRVATHED